MLEAYLDESGIHDGAHACVIAGYWGGAKRWRSFEKTWNKVIENADTPGLNEFHATKFWARTSEGKRKGAYANWTDTKAERFLGDLLSCIGNHKIYPFGYALKIAAWKRLNKSERMFLTGGRYDRINQVWITPSAPNQTYYLPFQFAVVVPAMMCKPSLTVSYVFDLNKQFKQHTTKLFELLTKDQTVMCRDRIGQLTLVPSHSACGLQAADLLAYESYQFTKMRVDNPKPIKISHASPMLRAALKNLRSTGDFRFFDEEGLEISLKPLPHQLRTPIDQSV